MFQGTGERMTREPMAFAPSTMNIKVVAPNPYGLEDRSCQRSPRRKHHLCRSKRFWWRESVVPFFFSLVHKPADSTTLLAR